MTKSTKFAVMSVIAFILYLIGLNGYVKHLDDDEEDS